jgi:hypothetical protein
VINLGCQYTVELAVEDHVEGAYLDHDAMEIMIKHAIEQMLKTAGWAGYKVVVGSVCYETDYPILPPEQL